MSLDRSSTIYKGVFHEDVTYQHPLSVNNSNNNTSLKNTQYIFPPKLLEIETLTLN